MPLALYFGPAANASFVSSDDVFFIIYVEGFHVTL